ncbi:hypothetical protein WDU94_009879, partial [Cyamophila willieti]
SGKLKPLFEETGKTTFRHTKVLRSFFLLQVETQAMSFSIGIVLADLFFKEKINGFYFYKSREIIIIITGGKRNIVTDLK